MLLMQGNCLERMKEIPDSSVDMILADLPYGTTRNKWDNVIPFEPLWEQYRRIVKHGAAICLFSQMPFSAELVMSNPKQFRYEWIWEKHGGTGFLNANRMPMKIHEQILVFYDRLPTYNPQKRTGFEPGERRNIHASNTTNYGKFGLHTWQNTDGTRYPVDIIKFSNSDKTNNVHPTQKPVPLLEYLVRTYTNAGETVLDNVMGSGSTGVACVNTSRDFIGIELDSGYFEVAKKRIENAQKEKRQKDAQMNLFANMEE